MEESKIELFPLFTDVPRIRELPGSVVVKEGGTLDVECVFWASPAPTIYWLVYGTNTTVQLGARFLVTNVNVRKNTYIQESERERGRERERGGVHR